MHKMESIAMLGLLADKCTRRKNEGHPPVWHPLKHPLPKEKMGQKQLGMFNNGQLMVVKGYKTRTYVSGLPFVVHQMSTMA